MKLVVATGNQHKLDELRALLPGIPLVGLETLRPAPEPAETASTYAGNAAIKAAAAVARGAVLALADDSGLEVDALGGAPGVHSARYAPGADVDRREKLLRTLGGAHARDARFVCCIALAGCGPDLPLPDGTVRTPDGVILATGVVRGTITYTERGSGGFGYDPIFEVGQLGLTMAELEPAAKNRLSHRALACEAIRPLLQRIFLDCRDTDH